MSATLTMQTVYVRRPRYFVINDGANELEKKVDFHVRTGDCFATLATALGLLEDSLQDCITRGETPHSFHLMLLRELREDLLYLHREYRIAPKNETLI